MAKRVHFSSSTNDHDGPLVAPRNHKRPCVEGDILQRLEPQTVSHGDTVLPGHVSPTPKPAGPKAISPLLGELDSHKKGDDDDNDEESLDSNGHGNDDGHGIGYEKQDEVLEENAPTTTELEGKGGGREEGIDILAKLLTAGGWQSDRPRSVMDAVNQVRELLKAKPEEYCEKFALYGGHFVLLNAMKQWPDHCKLQGKLLLCLSWFVGEYMKHSTPSCAGRCILASIGVSMGGLDRIVAAMKKFPDSSQVQYHGILLVTFLCRDAIDPMDATVEHFLHLQGVSLVVQAMRDNFPHKKNLQKHGCRLLEELVCSMDYGDAPVMKREALAAVALAVENFPDSDKIHNHAANFMRAVLHHRQDAEVSEDETETEDEIESGDELD